MHRPLDYEVRTEQSCFNVLSGFCPVLKILEDEGYTYFNLYHNQIMMDMFHEQSKYDPYNTSQYVEQKSNEHQKDMGKTITALQ